MKHKRQTKAPREQGFALLIVFLLSASIAISLYLELPRVAFESERNREEMLIERGEEYARAVELFYRKNRRYPAKIEDLESFNERRYLRKRYKDPLTGKDEWRIIHMGAGGLSDSLVEKPVQGLKTGLPGSTGAQAASSTDSTAQPQLGPDGQPIPAEVNSVLARARPSDKLPVGRGVVTGQFGPGTPGYDPNNPNAQLQQQQDPNNPNFQNQNPNFGRPPQPQQNANGQPTAPPGFVYNTPGQPNYNATLPQGLIPISLLPNGGNNNNNVQPGGVNNGQFGQPNGGLPQQPNLGGANAAINAINNSLRNPNQGTFGPAPSGGATGFGQQTPSGFDQPTATTANQSANPFSPGIAGIASMQKGVGIKKYNDRSKFTEWEFVFDYRKPKKKGPASSPSLGLQPSNLGSSFNAPLKP